MDKLYIDANGLLDDSFRLADQIVKSGFKPDYIVGVWRGGAPVGIAVQEYLAHRGLPTDHIAIRTASYLGPGQRSAEVRVHGLGYIAERICADDALLIVDDVFDTGLSIEAVLHDLGRQCGEKMSRQVRVATVYYKPANKRVASPPDFFIHETEKWLVFPHELDGLSPQEIAQNKSSVIAGLTTSDRKAGR